MMISAAESIWSRCSLRGILRRGSRAMPRKKATTSAKRTRSRKRAVPRRRAPRSPARAIEAPLAELAHEIRTPLTGILALGELLTTPELGERERGWAAAIKNTGAHLALLTSLLVDV